MPYAQYESKDSLLNNLAWQEEKRIHELEQSQWTSGLTVKVRPLLGTAECIYRFPGGDVETYTMEYMRSEEGDYLQLWRSKNGWQHAVNTDCVPFGFHWLLEILQDLPDTEMFTGILNHPALAQLAALKLSLDRIIRITRYLHLDYPSTYLLLAALSNHNKFSYRTITREQLAGCFGVPTLTNGQSSALRRINLEGNTLEEIQAAMAVVVHHWLSIKKWVVHEVIIHPHVVLFLYQLVSHDPHIQSCRWVSCGKVDQWFGNTWHQRRMIESVVSQFLLMWFSLRRFGIKPQHLNSYSEIERVFYRETEKFLEADDITATKINVFKYRLFADIDPALHEMCENLYDEMRSDILYNDEGSVFLADGIVFMPAKGKVCEGFSHIETVGDLRFISGELENCAAYRVKEGITGRSEFWRYEDKSTGEVALLQITTAKYPAADCIVEFNGYANQGVSLGGKEAMQRWMLQQHD